VRLEELRVEIAAELAVQSRQQVAEGAPFECSTRAGSD
jgi:hypothetical protein